MSGLGRVIAACADWRIVAYPEGVRFIVERRDHHDRWHSRAAVLSADDLPGALERPSLGIPSDAFTGLLAALLRLEAEGAL